MNDNSKDNLEKLNIPERPLECSECKKPIAVCYTEILGESISYTNMCADCPELSRRLHGFSKENKDLSRQESTTCLACGDCGTTLNSLRFGVPLGCSGCYEVFKDILLTEINAAGKIPSRLVTTKKSTIIHIGRAPGQNQEMNPSLRLLALDEALHETIEKEDYEQAAWLRDQIKALTDKSDSIEGAHDTK